METGKEGLNLTARDVKTLELIQNAVHTAFFDNKAFSPRLFLAKSQQQRMVLITKQNKRKVYEYLLREGVIVIKRDPGLPEHKDTGIPNLHAMKLLQSLHSKNYVELVFCWHHFYYFVKTEGIKFLRTILGIPDEVVPLTYKKTKKNYTGVEEREEGDERPRGRGRGRGRGFGRGGGRGFGRGYGGRPRRGEEGGDQGEQKPEGEETAVNNEAQE